jgi:hypothetical protein
MSLLARQNQQALLTLKRRGEDKDLKMMSGGEVTDLLLDSTHGETDQGGVTQSVNE